MDCCVAFSKLEVVAVGCIFSKVESVVNFSQGELLDFCDPSEHVAAGEGMNSFPFRVVDLTHPVAPQGPVWAGDPETKRENVAEIAVDGYRLNRWVLGEHSGTHAGAPSHFIDSGRTIDSFEAPELLCPFVKVSIENDLTFEQMRKAVERVGENAFCGAFVLMETGWSDRWPDRDRIFERDENDTLVYPGMKDDCARWLMKDLHCAGAGSDAPGVDPGGDTEFRSGVAIADAGGLHLENLANLELLPERGWLFVGALPLVGGAGSAARVVAFI